jgi:Arc/MetJ family transcription regulator
VPFRNVACQAREAGKAKAVPVWLKYTYIDGNIVLIMKKTIHIDEALLKEARAATKAATDTETVRLGLEALVRHAAYQRMRTLRGSEPAAKDPPRRRARIRGAHVS